ncbi:MAG: hypothetical protein LC631_02685, partial [Desulfovibrionales bacterium]|nr:hypothetical protein [Desulfovibrionales bacterium]
MVDIIGRLKSLFKRINPELDLEIVQQNKQELRNKYVHFKLLLDANNSALRTMSEMKKALDSTVPFDMVFINGKATKATLNIYSMISQLNSLSGNQYLILEDVF